MLYIIEVLLWIFMDFRMDNIADVLGLLLGLALFYKAYTFRRNMNEYEAGTWEKAARDLYITAMLFTTGMAITLSTIIGFDPVVRMAINLVGNIFWAASAFFAYRMMRVLVDSMEVMFGG